MERRDFLKGLSAAGFTRIGVALSFYHDAWRTFPPAFIPDEGGNFALTTVGKAALCG